MSCNALDKVRGKLKICEKPLHHKGKHADGDHEWLSISPDSDDRVYGDHGREQP